MPDDNDGLDFSYDSYVSQVPEALRGQIEPAFKQYSESVQEKVGKYKPFDEVLDAGWTPEHVNVGLNLLQELNTNPQKVFNALIEEYPDLVQQLQQQQTPQVIPGQQQTPAFVPGQQNNNSTDMDIPPQLQQRLDQQEQLMNLMFQGFQQQQQTLTQRQEQEREQNELRQFTDQLNQVAPEDKYPRQFILSYIAQGQTPQEAVKSWTDWQTSQQQQMRSNGAPLIAPAGGGGLPSEPLDTSKLSDSERRNLITQYLQQSNSQT